MISVDIIATRVCALRRDDRTDFFLAIINIK